jgi:hypothetical protein
VGFVCFVRRSRAFRPDPERFRVFREPMPCQYVGAA